MVYPPAGYAPTPVQIEYAQPAVALPFRDRRGGLVTFGVLFIVFGSLAGCMGLVSPLSLIALYRMPGAFPGSRAVLITTMVMASFVYISVAAVLIWIGIGSVKSQRWVRPLILIGSTLTIVISLLSVGNSSPRLRAVWTYDL